MAVDDTDSSANRDAYATMGMLIRHRIIVIAPTIVAVHGPDEVGEGTGRLNETADSNRQQRAAHVAAANRASRGDPETHMLCEIQSCQPLGSV